MKDKSPIIKILNLYAGIGGNRKLWPDHVEVIAVEINPEIAAAYKNFFPMDKMVIGDAHEYLLKNFDKFDFIWSSPPYPSHSILNRTGRFRKARYPDMGLYEEIIFLKHNFNGKWVVENVEPYYQSLIPPQRSGRHCFWSNFIIPYIDLRTPKTLTDMNRQELMDWLDMHFEKNIYIKPNHCERQVLRNCVHPELGKYIFNMAFRFKQKGVAEYA